MRESFHFWQRTLLREAWKGTSSCCRPAGLGRRCQAPRSRSPGNGRARKGPPRPGASPWSRRPFQKPPADSSLTSLPGMVRALLPSRAWSWALAALPALGLSLELSQAWKVDTGVTRGPLRSKMGSGWWADGQVSAVAMALRPPLLWRVSWASCKATGESHWAQNNSHCRLVVLCGFITHGGV